MSDLFKFLIYLYIIIPIGTMIVRLIKGAGFRNAFNIAVRMWKFPILVITFPAGACRYLFEKLQQYIIYGYSAAVIYFVISLLHGWGKEEHFFFVLFCFIVLVSIAGYAIVIASWFFGLIASAFAVFEDLHWRLRGEILGQNRFMKDADIQEMVNECIAKGNYVDYTAMKSADWRDLIS